MPSYNSMKIFILQGLLWLYLFGLGYHMAFSLEPGFLDFDNLPDTNFSCVGKVIGGYYADLETNCQMFHVCTIGQLDEPMDIRFLCLNGTVFDQETRVCERIDEVDCTKSEQFYSLNLELYGNTQPSLLEESPETEPAIIIKSTTTTTTTTTTPRPKPTKQQYYTPATSPIVVTSSPKVISTHHFPINSQSDIRFNPEEINIRLNPSGVLTNIHSKTIPFHQEIYANSDISNNNNKKEVEITTPPPPKSVVSYGLTHNKPVTPADYGYTYQDDTKTEPPQPPPLPRHNFHYHHHNQNFRLHPYANQFRSTTYHPQTTQRKISPVTTYRTPYISSLKPPPYHTQHYRTEKPQRLQLPLPLLPTLPPLSFSSPAPFTLTRHIETKRYTKEHQSPPRIIISASASVSDDSGRRLNYSLGTIGSGQLLETPPTSYEEYKEEVLDPFFHDVPKLKKRSKRNTRVKHSDIIKSEQEAVDVLKFLFDWYKDHEKTTTLSIPLVPETITEINHKLPVSQSTVHVKDNELFRKGSKFNIIGDVLSSTEDVIKEETTPFKPPDYVDDNYEPLTYKEVEYEQNNEEGLKNKTALYEEHHNAAVGSQTKEAPERIEVYDKMKETEKKRSTISSTETQAPGSIDIITVETPVTLKKTGIVYDDINEEVQNITESKNDDVVIYDVDKDKTPSSLRKPGIIYDDEIKEVQNSTQDKNDDVVIYDIDKDKEILYDVERENQRNYRPRIPSRRRNKTNLNKPQDDKVIYGINKDKIATKYEDDKVIYDIDKDYQDLKRNKHNLDANTFSNRFQDEKTSYDADDKKPYDTDTNHSRRNENNLPSPVEGQEQEKVIYDTVKEIITTAIYEDTNKTEQETTENYNVMPTELDTTTQLVDETTTSSFSNLIETVTKLISDYLNPIEDSEPLEERPLQEFTTFTTEVTTQTPVLTKSDTTYVQSNDEIITEQNVSSSEEVTTQQLTVENYVETTSPKPISTTRRTRGRGRGRSRFSYNNYNHGYEASSTVSPRRRTTEETTAKHVISDEINTTQTLPMTTQKPKVNITTTTAKTTTFTNIETTTGDSTENVEVVVPSKTEQFKEETTKDDTYLQTTRSNFYIDADEITEVDTTTKAVPTTETEIPPTETQELTTTSPKPKPIETTTTKTEELTTVTITSTTSTTSAALTHKPFSEENLEDFTLSYPSFTATEFTTNPDNKQYVLTTQTIEEIEANTGSIAEINLSTTEIVTTTSTTTTTEAPRRRTRPNSRQRSRSRHRFGTEAFTPKPGKRKPPDKIEDEKQKHAHPTERVEKIPSTDSSLYKSASPTQAETAKETLQTTPLSVHRHFIFNCFGKVINRFYSDPRDCRLFHYCTTGFNRNQLLDMKFVCDLGTFFDEEKLICTKERPTRCI